MEWIPLGKLHYKITLPWSDEGYRLQPAHFYFDWTEQMRKYDAEFECFPFRVAMISRVTMSAEEQARVAKEINTRSSVADAGHGRSLGAVVRKM